MQENISEKEPSKFSIIRGIGRFLLGESIVIIGFFTLLITIPMLLFEPQIEVGIIIFAMAMLCFTIGNYLARGRFIPFKTPTFNINEIWKPAPILDKIGDITGILSIIYGLLGILIGFLNFLDDIYGNLIVISFSIELIHIGMRMIYGKWTYVIDIKQQVDEYISSKKRREEIISSIKTHDTSYQSIPLKGYNISTQIDSEIWAFIESDENPNYDINRLRYSDIIKAKDQFEESKRNSWIQILFNSITGIIFIFIFFIGAIIMVWGIWGIMESLLQQGLTEGLNQFVITQALGENFYLEDLPKKWSSFNFIYYLSQSIYIVSLLLLLLVYLPGKLALSYLIKLPIFSSNAINGKHVWLSHVPSSSERYLANLLKQIPYEDEQKFLVIDRNTKTINLVAIHPEWELEDVLSVFYSYLSIIPFIMLITVITFYFDPDILSANLYLVFGSIAFFLTYFIYRYFRSSWKYFSIRRYIIQFLEQEIFNFSFHAGTNTDGSASTANKIEIIHRQNQIHRIENKPVFPYSNRIRQLASLSIIFTIISPIYSFLFT